MGSGQYVMFVSFLFLGAKLDVFDLSPCADAVRELPSV